MKPKTHPLTISCITKELQIWSIVYRGTWRFQKEVMRLHLAHFSTQAQGNIHKEKVIQPQSFRPVFSNFALKRLSSFCPRHPFSQITNGRNSALLPQIIYGSARRFFLPCVPLNSEQRSLTFLILPKFSSLRYETLVSFAISFFLPCIFSSNSL